MTSPILKITGNCQKIKLQNFTIFRYYSSICATYTCLRYDKLFETAFYSLSINLCLSSLKFLGNPHLRLCLPSKSWSVSSICKYLGASTPRAPEKVDLGGSKRVRPTFLIVDQSSPDFFPQMREELFSITCLSDFGYLVSFERYLLSLSKSGVAENHLEFCMFWGGRPQIFGLAL